MFPDLFSIGPFTLHTYGLLVAGGCFVGLMVAVKIGKSDGMSAQQVVDMGFIIILSAVIGSRVMYVIINLPYYVRQPSDIFKLWQGGLVFSGGVIFVFLSMALYVRRHHLSYLKVADLWAPSAAIGQGIGRIGCLMAGCCYGKPTDMKWGIMFTHPNSLAPLNVNLHPTQLYSSLSSFIIFLILLLLNSKKKFEGQVILWFLILHSTARLAIERFRGDERGMLSCIDMTVTQFTTLFILVGAVVSLIVIKSRADKKTHLPPE
jgi:phosphatidylglycerol:prolipoprotein diacylglycerol transferase